MLLTCLAPALRSVLTVAATAAVGAYAKHRGALDDAGVKVLEKLIAEVFTPSLVLLKVLPNVTVQAISSTWPMALNCAVMIAFGFWSGQRVCHRLHYQYPEAFPQLTALVSVAVAFPNSFSVPLTLFLTIADHPALMRWPDTSSTMVADRGASLFLLSYMVWIVARWTIGYPVLTGACYSCGKWARKVLNPPVIALLIALPAGGIAGQLHLTEPVETASPANVVRASLWLSPFSSAIQYASRCLVPCTLFTLGAQLSSVVQLSLRRPELDFEPADDKALATAAEEEAAPSSSVASGGPRHVTPPTLPPLGILSVVFLRQVCGPAIGICIALFLKLSGALTDPVALMVMLLQSCGESPLPQSLARLPAGGARFERISCRGHVLRTFSLTLFSLLRTTASARRTPHDQLGGYGRAGRRGRREPRLCPSARDHVRSVHRDLDGFHRSLSCDCRLTLLVT